MKKILFLSVFTIMIITFGSCKKFLSLDPPNDLSGNNFWKSKQDVEQFTNGLYGLFRQATFRSNMKAAPGNDEFPFFTYTGDFRGAPIRASSFAGWRTYFNQLTNNNIRGIMTPGTDYGNYYTVFNHQRFAQWDRFYKVIAAANIAVERVDDVPGLTEAEKGRYKGEAVFMRNLTYFFMVRIYGDVPYYTDAYNTEPLARMPMVEVLKNLSADMMKYKDGLPWTYDDPAIIAVRAMRGSALVLNMQINMWLAGFDAANATKYYEEVAKSGKELLNDNGGAYTLLPIEQTRSIFKGRTKEGLFEIPQNVNYGESFGWSAFADNVLRAPYKNIQIKSSYIYYQEDFMRELYPEGEPDKRKENWFEAASMFKSDGTFLMLKFANVYANQTAEDVNPDDNQTVFRLSGAMLLQAEALAHLGDESGAKAAANLVRARAGATPFTSSGKELLDDIFFERCRELMGEGHYWYDVVRTKRIIDQDYKYGYHCSVQQFKDGAWTWPIAESARVNNPNIVLNNYWR